MGIGGNQNDGDILTPAAPYWGAHDGFHFSLQKMLDTLMANVTRRDDVLSQYTLDEFHTEMRMVTRFMRDFVFECSSRNVARAFHDHGVPVWLYSFGFDFGSLFGKYNFTKTI